MTPLVTALWTVVPLASQGPAPSSVKPGWLAFFIVLAMGAATFLLWLSFRKQLKKIHFPEDDAATDSPAEPQASDPAAKRP